MVLQIVEKTLLFFCAFTLSSAWLHSLHLPVRICRKGHPCRHTEDDPPYLNGIGFVGSGYDIFKGNPQAIQETDPGFLDATNIFNFTYASHKTTTDGAYLIPDGTTVNSVDSCSFSFSSSITSTSQAYTDSLKVNVDANFKYMGASFSASTDYQEVTKGTSSGSATYVTSQAMCQTYGASIDDAPLIPKFISEVHALPPTNDSLNPYIALIRKWGTHVASSIMMGGRYGLRSEFTSSNYVKMSSTGLNIKAAAGYSGMISISGSLTTDIQTKQADSYEQNRESVKVFQYGGKPPVGQNGSTFEWAQHVKKKPMPLSYTLTELYRYLNNYYFPSDQNITTKRSILKTALDAYCKQVVPDPQLCDAEYGPKNDTIQVFTESTLYHSSEDFFVPFLPPPKYVNYDQLSENPDLRAFGGIMASYDYYSTPNASRFVIPTLSVPSQYIDYSIGTVGTGNYSVRFSCKEGYSTISDYPYIEIRNQVPGYYGICIKNECLAQCNKGEHYDNQQYTDVGYFIANGYPELGNPDGGGFYRDMSIEDSAPESDLLKCLTYKCLEIV